ncbi:MAG: hypothetical protein JO264_13225 [Acidisphaera sp.]|nr:hypothetical protein [Acidisphaera sp.]
MTAPGSEARQRAVTSLAMIGVVVLAAFFVLQARFFDPKELMTYEDTDGPFVAQVLDDKTVQLGATTSTLPRGGTFGWVSTLCIARDVAMAMQLRLVYLPERRTILYQDRSYAPNARPCGPLTLAMRVPDNAPLGAYQLQRSIMLSPLAGSPRSQKLPPLALEIVP